jgi:hypothetical protein
MVVSVCLREVTVMTEANSRRRSPGSSSAFDYAMGM